MADKRRFNLCNSKYSLRDKFIKDINQRSVKPEEINEFLKEKNTSQIHQSVKLEELIKRPEIKLEEIILKLSDLRNEVKSLGQLKEEIIESTEILIKYSGYIEREKIMAEKFKRLDKIKIPEDIDYLKIHSISTEARQKLFKIRPKNLSSASKIDGVSPADISVLLIFLGR